MTSATAPTQTVPEVIYFADCVAEKKRRQAIIYRETKGMTNAEVMAYFRKGAEEFDREVEQYRAERKAASEDLQ
jgi:hypothetical protein